MMSLMQLLPMPPAEIASGRVTFQGQDLVRLDASAIRQVRGARIGFVFQDPMTSLNPVFTVGFQIMEPLREHMGLSRKAARKRAIELLDLVGIPATPRSWVIQMIAMPSFWRRSRTSSRICACTVTSSAVVGSSAISTLGSQASAIAMTTRWRMPPENWCG